MPSAAAEAKAAAMDNAVDVWRLTAASRLHILLPAARGGRWHQMIDERW